MNTKQEIEIEIRSPNGPRVFVPMREDPFDRWEILAALPAGWTIDNDDWTACYTGFGGYYYPITRE